MNFMSHLRAVVFKLDQMQNQIFALSTLLFSIVNLIWGKNLVVGYLAVTKALLWIAICIWIVLITVRRRYPHLLLSRRSALSNEKNWSDTTGFAQFVHVSVVVVLTIFGIWLGAMASFVVFWIIWRVM
jgi:hypothetical protein